jgi:hypothetical protein
VSVGGNSQNKMQNKSTIAYLGFYYEIIVDYTE